MGDAMSTDSYLLAGKDMELERLQRGSRMLEPAGRRLLAEIGDGQGARVVDVGCGALGWLRLLSEWVGPDGQVVRRHRSDDTISDTEVANCSGRTRSVEPQAAAHDDIEILVLVIHTTHAAECNPK